MTIHSWGAVAPNSTNVDTLISYIKKCKPALQRWKNTQVLVIDEGMYLPDYSFDFRVLIFNTMVGIKQSRWSMDTCLIQSLLSLIDCVLRVPNHLVAFRFEACTGSNRLVLMFYFPYPPSACRRGRLLPASACNERHAIFCLRERIVG